MVGGVVVITQCLNLEVSRHLIILQKKTFNLYNVINFEKPL